MQKLPASVGENAELMEMLDGLFEWLVDPCLDFIRKNVKVRQLLDGCMRSKPLYPILAVAVALAYNLTFL